MLYIEISSGLYAVRLYEIITSILNVIFLTTNQITQRYIYMNSSFIKALPVIVLTGILYGSNLVVSRYSLGQFPPLAYISLRFLIASACYLGLYIFIKGHSFPRDPKIIFHACIYGIVGTAIPLSCSVYALKYLSSGVTSLLITLNPVLTVLIAHYALDDEPLTCYRFVGAIIALCGAGLLILRGETGLSEITGSSWNGFIWLIPVVLGLTIANIYARKYLMNAEAIDGAAIRIMISAVIMTPMALLTNSFQLQDVNTSGVLVLIYVGIAGTFFAFLLNFFIVKKYGATAVSTTTYISPAAAAALGAIFLGEEITILIIAGMIIMFLGITIMGYSPKNTSVRYL